MTAMTQIGLKAQHAHFCLKLGLTVSVEVGCIQGGTKWIVFMTCSFATTNV